MQPFDPKLFESQNTPERKQSNTISDRAVRRTDKTDEGRRSRKKFKLDDKKSKSKETNDERDISKSDLPSAFSLAGKRSVKDSTQKQSQDSEEEAFAGEEETAKSEKKDEQPKVVNPLTSELEDVKAEAKVDAAAKSAKASRAKLEVLMKSVVDSITQMKLDGKTETTVVIKHPPLFANAKLTITTQDSAKGEYNITFSELNAQAKELLDAQAAKESLMRTLEEKGYIMHILVATTEKEETLLTAAETGPHEDRSGEQQEEKEGREQKEEE